MNIGNIIRGIGGEPEIIRTLGVAGVLVYIVSVPAFTAYMVFGLNRDFDLIGFCAGYPAGLGVALAAIAGSNALKDRNVAVAKVTQDTGSAPGAAAVPPGEPIEATIVNKSNNPVPTTTDDKK